jgi:hypothetical protein
VGKNDVAGQKLPQPENHNLQSNALCRATEPSKYEGSFRESFVKSILAILMASFPFVVRLGNSWI